MKKARNVTDLLVIRAHTYKTLLERSANKLRIFEQFEVLFNYYIKVSSYHYPRLKEVDDVLGGSAAWENVDNTDGMDLYPCILFYNCVTIFYRTLS